MNIPAPTQEYNGYKYYLASKPFGSRKWHFTNRSFVLSVTDYVVGQFITTMWFNRLCDSDNWGCEIAIVRVAVGARPEEFKAVSSIMDSLSSLGEGCGSYDGVVMHGVLENAQYKECVRKLQGKLSNNRDRGSASVSCDIKMSTPGLIIMTLQGSYNDDGELVVTLTLPTFRGDRELM